MGDPRLSRKDFNWYQKQFLVRLIDNPNLSFGMFIFSYEDKLERELIKNSNLGTPPGVYNPPNNEIIRREKNFSRAVSLFEDFVEIYDEE